jgi:PKD repeat protein
MPIFCGAQLSLSSITFPDKIEEGKFLFYSIAKDGEDHSEYYSCTWDMDDGTKRVMLNQFELGHVFVDDGNYLINFKAKDSKDQEVSISQQVTVTNVDPEVRYLDGKVDDWSNRRVKFEAIAYDPGSDELTYKWNFGDGNTKEGKQFDEVTHTYDQPGVYKVRVTVNDGDDGTDYKEMSISVETDWHATISGDYNFELSGGAGLMYQTRIDNITEEVLRCFKMFTFYDDNNNSFLNVGTNTLNRLAGKTHIVGPDHRENFNVIMHHDMKPSMYANMSSRFRMQEIEEDSSVIFEKSFQQLSLISDMRNAIGTGEDLYGIEFSEISGTFKVEPIKGNRLKGEMSALLEGSITDADGEITKKLIHINLEFNVRVNDVAKEHMERGCEEEADPFYITNYSPRDGKVNVNVDEPCLEVEFSEAVDPLSILNTSIVLGYYSPSGVFVPEFPKTEFIENNKIKIVPTRPLRYGVKYEVFIYSDDRGLRSMEGGKLSEDEHWKFSTQIVPSDYKIRVYQTLADAPLVEDKQTMVRVELNWDRPKNIAKSSLVDEFPATVHLKTKSGIDITKSHMFKHQDFYSKLDTTRAKNSVNIFDWMPLELDGNLIFIDIVPDFQTCVPDYEKVTYTFQHTIKHAGIKSRLKQEYYYLKSNEDEILSEDLKFKMFEYVERNDRYSEMIYPIYDIRSTYKGEIHIEGDKLFDEKAENAYNDIVLNSSADIVVFLYTLKEGAPGETFREQEETDRFKIQGGKEFVVIRFEEVEKHLIRPTLSHEMGHSFYLEHLPYIRDVENANEIREAYGNLPLDDYEDRPGHEHIDGFKIGRNGRYSFNKSCLEGNAEADGLTTFMYPHLRNVRYDVSWINRSQFDDVINHIKKYRKGLSFNPIENQNNTNWVSLNTHSPNLEVKTLYVSSVWDKKKNQVSVKNIKNKLEKRTFNQEPGSMLIQALDKNGNVIAKESFESEPEIISCDLSEPKDNVLILASIEIPIDVQPKVIQFVEQNNVLGEFKISDNVPTVQLLFSSINDTINGNLEIAWEASDLDNEDLTYSVYYTAGDLNEWQMKGITSQEKLNIKINDLPSGPSPTFKVVASDGYHETEAIVPVHIDFPFDIRWITPSDSASVQDDFRIHFSNAITPSPNANRWFSFVGTDSIGLTKNIEYEVEYAEDYKSLILLPYHELDPKLDYKISYGIHPPKPKMAMAENEVHKSKQRRRPFKDFLAKQVDKLTSDDGNEENSNVLKEMLGLPTKEVPKKEELVEEEKRSSIADRLGLTTEEEVEVFVIQDIFGNELSGYYATQFRIF